jgi:hypothetical protein
MRRARASFLAASGVCAFFFLAGCTFLVSFDEKPGAKDAGSTRDVSTRPTATETSTFPTSTQTTTSPIDSGPPPETCDTALNLNQVNGCEDFAVANALVCAKNGSLQPYPFTTTQTRDLVTCNGGNAICVKHCQTNCSQLPDGIPDQCDRCTGRRDGTYCGKELGWDTRANEVLVRCVGGTMSSANPAPVDCDTTCQTGNNLGTATCL